MSFFDALFGDGGAKDAANAQKAGLNAGKKAAFKQLDTGLNAATGSYNTAEGYFDPYAETAGKANTSYADALGLNGADGTGRAQTAFQASPGYAFQLDQGLQALDRTASARGMLGSGNLSADTIDYARGLADQEYGGYLDRLSGLQQQGIGIAGAKAGIRTGVGDLQYGTGQNKANIAWNKNVGSGNAEANGILTGNQNIFNKVTGALSFGASVLGAPFTGGTSLAARFATAGKSGLF